jgi:hypothetical protein
MNKPGAIHRTSVMTLRIALLALIFNSLGGCAADVYSVKKEPKAVSISLGLNGCQVSVPMSISEVEGFVSHWYGIQLPLDNPEWAAIVNAAKPGDQIRDISCPTVQPYYGLIRDGKVLLKYYPVIFD